MLIIELHPALFGVIMNEEYSPMWRVWRVVDTPTGTDRGRTLLNFVLAQQNVGVLVRELIHSFKLYLLNLNPS